MLSQFGNLILSCSLLMGIVFDVLVSPGRTASLACLDELASAEAAGDQELIYIGHRPDTPYVVAVPGRDHVLLETLKGCYPMAFITTFRLGAYIQVAAYESHRSAKPLADWLRSQQMDARVIYRP